MTLEWLVILVCVLLPIAALSGWLVGRRTQKNQQDDSSDFQQYSKGYFKGLNYLLNERPDEAIEVFVELANVDSNTLETHYALANLFRRRGEVERAIRIHQNIIARPTLSNTEKNQALYELGLDYMSAGLYDRAENVFQQVMKIPEYQHEVMMQLIDLYQREKDWEQAVAIANRIRYPERASLSIAIAHYYCELAELALKERDYTRVLQWLKRAKATNNHCVRAYLLEASLHNERENYKAVIKQLEPVAVSEPQRFPECLDLIQTAYSRLGREQHYMNLLESYLQQHNHPVVSHRYVQLYAQYNGEDEALSFLRQYMQNYPSLMILEDYLEHRLKTEFDVRGDLSQVRDAIHHMFDEKIKYRCTHCGFNGKTLHWQCPSCKKWDTFKSLLLAE